MFEFIRKIIGHKETMKAAWRKASGDLVFRSSGLIDVTDFNADESDNCIGFLSSGDVLLYPDGHLVIWSEKNGCVLEETKMADIVNINNNINHFDPYSETKISLMTWKKDIRICFESVRAKNAFWNAFICVYNASL